MSLVYLDNAATSFPKPKRVLDEVSTCIRDYCGNPGRSAHPLAIASSEKIFECRELLASFFGSDRPENVIFTQNTTYALNMAIKGLVRRGDHLLISDMEHNSVFRPVAVMAKAGFIDYDVFPTVKDGCPLSPDELRRGILRLIRPGKTRILICSHIPNIASSIRPIGVIGDICKRNGILFIVDAAQSAGHIKINMKGANIDVLCAPGHKGLFGIQGCGFMILGDSCPPLATLIEGGNGINSLESDLPDLPPERFESGTLPTPSIAALSEGIKFLSEFEPNEIKKHEDCLFFELYDRLLCDRLKARIYVPSAAGAVLLFNIKDLSSDEVCRALAKKNICLRGGYHCSALGHKALSTQGTGAIRASFGIFNTRQDVDALYKTLLEII